VRCSIAAKYTGDPWAQPAGRTDSRSNAKGRAAGVCVAILLNLCLSTSCFAGSYFVRSFELGGPYFHAGRLAVESYPHWRMVPMGPVPTVLGALKYGTRTSGVFAPALKIVAIVSQDAPAYGLMIAKTAYDDIAADPAGKLPGQRLMLTQSSTAQLYAESCLSAWNLRLDQVQVIDGEQEAIRNAVADRKVDIGFVWSPFTFLTQTDQAKAKMLACQDMAAFDMPYFVVVRADLLTEPDPLRAAANRKRIADYVARLLGAWASAANKPADAAKRLVKTYAEDNVKVTEAEARAELAARRPPDLDGQRIAFRTPAVGAAPLAVTLDGIMDFMVRTGTLAVADRPAAAGLIDGSILEMISGDPALTATANGTAP
jgi:ABC-type nitrate/sulfonate/bicarbonate transport system substrate-binding protein